MKATVINLESRPKRMVDFRKNNFPFEVKRFNAIKTDPGWFGCTASHLQAIREQTEFPFVIFEDDCVLLQPWSMVEMAMSQLPADWDMLWLGATNVRSVERYSNNLFRMKGAYCAHACIFNSQRVYDYILTNHKRFFKSCEGTDHRPVIDVFYVVEIQERFNCFITDPICATQSVTYSDIEMKVNDYEPYINNVQNIFNSHPR
ncbi:MAG TPA: hypothetical protein VMV77_08840 [Bacteroidales bacterium]|nr:hypothetical protein [Bacteroidales bacterium]